ncbi:MAG TPA: carboxypeptidase regulatory-like domain-containing protein [Gammaproteobacteria bacterium]|nr:carboxypeptidase regulatory-like domain-containing protein [Gammaproteobacteria bacterium]
MPGKRIAAFIGAVLCLCQISAQAGQQAGVNWLRGRLDTSGRFDNQNGLVLDFQAAGVALEALKGTGADSELVPVIGYLDTQTYPSTASLARRIIARRLLDQDASAQVALLVVRQNADGGFGELPSYQSTVLDTAVALRALGVINQDAAQNALHYLLARQTANGSWADWEGASAAYVTAQVVEALAPWRNQITVVGSATQSAETWLGSVRGSDGGWGEAYVTAETLNALTATGTEPTLIDDVAEYLRGIQNADGSWGQDVFTTALAVRALRATEKVTAPTQPVGSAAGYVVEAGTGKPIAGANVSIASSSKYSATTNSDGYYRLANLPVGPVTVVGSAVGYSAAVTTAVVESGSTATAPPLVLAQVDDTALVYGRVTAQQDGTPVAGAKVQLSGPDDYGATTDDDGGFAMGAVSPGDYTLTISAAGYITTSGSVSFDGGQQYRINQPLLLEGTYPSDEPIDVTATLVDASSGTAITGATLKLDSVLSASSGADGSVTIADVPPGTYQASVSMSGYATGLYTITLIRGSNGDLGALRLYPETGAPAPSTLTLIGSVVSGLGGEAVAGATITRLDTGATWTSDAEGRFTISDIDALHFTLQIAANGYKTRQFTVAASGYGSVSGTFSMAPAGGDPTATAVALSGHVKDVLTGAAIANATISIVDSPLSAQSESSGSYNLTAIPDLSFTLQVSAVGYETTSLPISVSQYGDYMLDVPLTAVKSASALRISSVNATPTVIAATDIGVIDAVAGNVSGSDVVTTLFAEITNSQGSVIADVSGRKPGASDTSGAFTVPAGSQVPVEFDWVPKQLSPGPYTVTVYAVVPGTGSRSNPLGTVLATGATIVTVRPTKVLAGQLAFDPPLVQAGTENPVALAALAVNAGNVTLDAQSLHMTITDPASGDVIYSATGQMPSLSVNNNATVSFGSWIPTATGNLQVRVEPVDSEVTGKIDGKLYVGNKANGQFTVDRNIVAPGDNTVHATVAMQGVDLTQGTSTDPLFFAVQRSVTDGGTYVDANAESWQSRHRCLGCHIQSQSLTGLASSIHKAEIDPQAVKYLATSIATSQQADGGYRLSYPGYAETQAVLNLWALNRYQDNGTLFRNKLAAAMYLHHRRRVYGNQTYWYPDYWSGWWASQDKLTALAVTGLADVLQAAESADVSQVVHYVWNTLFASTAIASGRDLQRGQDGRLYALEQNGAIAWFDPVNKTSGVIATGLTGSAYGLAVANDGSFYISGVGYVAHVVIGEASAFIWQGSGTVTGLALTSAGKLYGINQSHSQLLYFSGSSANVVLDDQTLNHPAGLAVDASDNLMIADTGNYDLIQISPEGKVIRWAQGLGQEPVRLVSDGQAGWYVRSNSASPLGYYDPPELYHFMSDGVGERIANATNLHGITLLGNTPIAIKSGSAGGLVALDNEPVDVASQLTVLRQDIVGSAHYFLNRYRDSNSQMMTQALRLWGMAEARKVVTDPALDSQLDDAISYLDNKLRGSQNADGGWGRYSWYGSDALVTAIVGLALDYSHPSAQDSATRSAIQYLLNTQAGDGSWYSANRIMSTRLSTTSLVMDYMPEALDLLGGLDVDLLVRDTPKASLANFVPAFNDVSIGVDAASTYHWHLTGVRSSGREVQFDVNLPAMLANEERPAAASAQLQFHNSFDDSIVSFDLPVPHIKAISGLGITVATDSTQYGANAPVQITGIVGNNGAPLVNGVVRVRISAPDGTPVATLVAASDLQLAAGAQVDYGTRWNTATYIPGPYKVTASIVDDSGVVADTATTTFDIIASGSGGDEAASLRTTTDKAAYNTTDTVNIADLAENLTANAKLSLAHLHVDIIGPKGNIIQIFDHNLGELAPGAERNVPDALTLNHATEGDYQVAAQLSDATDATLAEDHAVFSVADQPGRNLVGHVQVQRPSVYQGDTEICTDSLLNNGVKALVDQPIERLLLDVNKSSTLNTLKSTVDINSGQRTQLKRGIDTGALAVGDYVCALQARINGDWKPLDHAAFHVALPPIIIDSSFRQTGRGRLLVLLDAPKRDKNGKIVDDRDPHGKPFYPGLSEQRQWLEQFLTEEGWSYTIVTSADAFEHEFKTHGYALYALFSEQVKLPEALQHDLVDEVKHGVGLLLAGSHDRRNGRLEEALGIKSQGVSPHASGIDVQPFGQFVGGGKLFALDNKPLKMQTEGASVLARYSGPGSQSGAAAVTFYTPVEGRGMFVGFDLLQQALADHDSQFLQSLLANVLTYTHPASLAPYAGAVLPFRITLVNKGRATPGRVTLTLPAGAVVVDPGNGDLDSAGQPVWVFALGKAQIATWRLWIKLPPHPGAEAFTATIETGEAPNYDPYAQTQLQVQVVPRP